MLINLALSIWFALLPVHVALTSIEHVPGTDSLKVMVKMDYDLFLRDYQTIDDDRDLHELYSYKPFPAELATNYFNSKVFIRINNKLLIGKLLTMDIDDGEVRLYILCKLKGKPKEITLKNTILTSLHSDQENLAIIRINGIEEGIKLTVDVNEQTLSLK
jgi:hypothetical protein